MASTSIRHIRQGIRAHLLSETVDDIDPSRICWENAKFTPPVNQPNNSLNDPYWLRETLHIAVEKPVALEHLNSIGIVTFDVFYPVARGTERIEDLLQIVASAFEKIAYVTYEGTVTSIYNTERKAAIKVDDAWYMGSISIYWRSYTPSTSVSDKF